MKFGDFLENARTFTDSMLTACRCNGEKISVTFPRLLDEADRLANDLRKSGLKEGQTIGLCLPNSYEFVLWDLATIKTGNILQVFSESLPFSADIYEAKAKDFALLVTNHKDAVFDQKMCFHIAENIDNLSDYINSHAPIEADQDLHSRVYSSGTSGYLKGLNISKKGSELLANDFINEFKIGCRDSQLIFLPLSNYQQRLSIYAALDTGVNLTLTDFSNALLAMQSAKPTFIISPPAIYESIYHAFCNESNAKEKVKAFLGGNIRFAITGMAPIHKPVLIAFNEEYDIKLLEAYGVTETGIIAWNTFEHQKLGTVGCLVHPDHVEFSNEGEIIINRPTPWSKGYFRSKDADDKKTFLIDGRIATGDIGFIDGDGFLVLKGRLKEIIITNAGAKFHPEEIENILKTCTDILQCVVMWNDSKNCLSAVIVAKDPQNQVAIQQHINQYNNGAERYKKIAHYAISSEKFTIENGLLTRNMKIDRKKIYRYFFETKQIESALS